MAKPTVKAVTISRIAGQVVRELTVAMITMMMAFPRVTRDVVV